MPPPLSFPPVDGQPVHFLEAIRAAEARGVVLPEVYYGQLQGVARQLAFSITGIANLDQLQAVKGSLTKALAAGQTFKQWQREQAVKDLKLPRHRLDNIFRTNIQSQYMAGRWEQIERNKQYRPYLMYDAINDARVRPAHKAMDGIIRAVDDAFWATHSPPNGYRCRCGLISLSEAQARARSKEGTGLDLKINEVAMRPDQGWDISPRDRLQGIEQAVAKRLESGGVLSESLIAFIQTHSSAKTQQQALALGVKTVDYAGSDMIAGAVNASLAELKQRGLPMPDHVRVDEAAFKAWAQKLATPVEDLVATFAVGKLSSETFLFLNPLYQHWHDLKADAAYQHGVGEWSTAHEAHGLYHELGHLAHYKASAVDYHSALAGKFTEAEGGVASRVSLYAATNPAEFIAETFAILLNGERLDDEIRALYEKFNGPKL